MVTGQNGDPIQCQMTMQQEVEQLWIERISLGREQHGDPIADLESKTAMVAVERTPCGAIREGLTTVRTGEQDPKRVRNAHQ